MRRQREHQKWNKKKPKNSLISIKNNFARVAHFFVHFFAVDVA